MSTGRPAPRGLYRAAEFSSEGWSKATATAALLTIAIVAEVRDTPFFRVTAVVAVLSVLGTALVPVLRSMRQTAD